MSKNQDMQMENKTLLTALLGVLLILISVSIKPVIIIAILFCSYVVWFNENDLMTICCIACWLSLTPIFKLNADGASFYTYTVMLFAMKQLIKNREIDKYFLLILFIYALYLIPGMGVQLMTVIRNVMMPVQLYVMARCLNYEGLKKVSGYFILGVFIDSTLATFNSFIPNLSDYIANDNAFAVSTLEGYVAEPRFSGLWIDPNFYSIHLLIGILICIVLYSRREISSLAFYSVVAMLTYFGAKTLSKSFILMLAVALGYAYILFIKNKQYGSVVLMSLILLILLVLIAAGVIDVFSMIMERLREGITSGESLTTGRTDLWKEYSLYFCSHPLVLLFGGGLSVQIPFRLGPHNAYLELILFIGVIGSFLFCLTIYNAVAASWNSKIRGTSVPFLLTLVMFFFLGVYNSPDLQFELLLSLGYLWMNKEAESGTDIWEEGDCNRKQEINLNC